MDVYVTGALWVFGASAVSAVIGYLVRRYGQEEGRANNNEAAGQAFTIIGGLHAVVVAFVLISLFDAVNTARAGSFSEARALVSAAWAAESLPDPAPARMRELAKDYANGVVNQEWPALSEGAPVPDQGWTELDAMRATVDNAAIPPDDDWLQNQKAAASSDLNDLYEARQQRLNTIADNQVGSVLWFVLAVGSLLFALLPNLFGGTRMMTHVLIVSALAAVTTLLCFAIYQLQNPFGDGAKVGSEAFTQALARLNS